MSDHQVIEIKSGFVYSLRFILKSNDLTQIEEALVQKLDDTGSLFKESMVLLDLNQLEPPFDIRQAVQLFEHHGLKVIGISAQGELHQNALFLGLTCINPEDLPNKPAPEPKPTQEAIPLEEPMSEACQPTMVLNRPLRSGQRVYAKNADVMIIGSVSRGAEVIADGNIHVYGPLRGRAIAGARGNVNARIFTMHLDPELVAIAGIYRLIDPDFSPETLNQPALIELENESLIFHSADTFN